MNDNISWLPFLLQTADPLFPTGAYAHSLGLEESVRLGIVRDQQTLCIFLRDQIVPAQREQELPYLRFAFDAADAGLLSELCTIDAEIGAWKLAPEARQASVQLGVRRLKALSVISNAPLLQEVEQLISTGACYGHHLVVCGIQAIIGGVPLRAALAAAFYQAISAICAAAMKLIRIGQLACQNALHEAVVLAHETIRQSLLVSRDHAGWFNPLLEIAGLRHERAEERLFIS